MYGYVRPVRGELRVREYERFRGVYCGLCHTLRRRYGPAGRFLVNYDFTFLAMLLTGPAPPACRARRCPYHPLRRTVCPDADGAMELAADYSVILAWWKLRDGVRDGGFFRALACRLGCLALRGAYKRAAALRPAFAGAVRRELGALDALERARCDSLDAVADKFALLLRAAAEPPSADGRPDDPRPDGRTRALRELLYHLGRMIYVLDAADDLPDDEKTGAYNPLRYRFVLRDGKLSGEDAEQLRLTLTLSQGGVSAAFALLEPNAYQEILTNIIYLGLPAVTQAVLQGRRPRGKGGET